MTGPSLNETFVEVEGGRIWSGITGDGPGDPLVCIHGGPGSTHADLLPLMAIGGRRIVFYDQLGCGASDRPADDSLWTLERFVDELERLREILDLERVHVLGHSWGGAIATAYAARRPTGLTSVILSSPLVSSVRWAEDMIRLRSALPDEVLQVLIHHEDRGYTSCPEYAAASLVFYKRHLCRLEPWPDIVERSFDALNFELYLKMWGPSEHAPTGSLSDMDLSDRLPRIECPALFVCGRHDEATPESTQHFAGLVPRSEFKVFENSSHSSAVEEPTLYMDVINDFLRRGEGGHHTA